MTLLAFQRFEPVGAVLVIGIDLKSFAVTFNR